MRSCIAFIAASVMLTLGCATTQTTVGQKLLASEDYEAAATQLRKAVATSPDDVDLRVDLAEVYYHLGRLDSALVHADRARSFDSSNSEAILLSGLIHEKQGNMDRAIDAYRSYAQFSRLGKARKIIKARLDRLIRVRIRQDTHKALAQEEFLDVAAIPVNTLAVAPFRNMSANESLDPLQKGLAEMMITDLSKVPDLKVLERIRMQEMMKEIGLTQTGAVDPATAPRLGKLLGAARVVNGSFTDLTGKDLRLDITVSKVKTAMVDASEVTGPLEKLFRLQKELTFGLVEEMGIELTDEQRDAIQELPTENMLAFIAYSRGLDLEDQGQAEAAAAAFAEASSLDPDFSPAQEAVERVEVAEIAAADISVVEEAVMEEAFEEVVVDVAAAEPAPATPVEETPTTDIIDRLATTGQYTGAGFIPTSEEGQSEVREPLEEQEEVTFGGAEIEIVVPLPQPGSIEATGTFEE